MATANDTERWLPIPGWEGLYEVSDLGRVRSCDREVTTSRGVRRYKGRPLSPGTNLKGHRYVHLMEPGRKRTARVHQLVLEAFVGPAPEGLIACHWDDDKTNNRLSNLRWGTHRENGLDRTRNGLDHNANKTHCIRGHEFTAENTRIEINHNGPGRRCRTCERERLARAERAKRKSRRTVNN